MLEFVEGMNKAQVLSIVWYMLSSRQCVQVVSHSFQSFHLRGNLTLDNHLSLLLRLLTCGTLLQNMMQQRLFTSRLTSVCSEFQMLYDHQCYQ